MANPLDQILRSLRACLLRQLGVDARDITVHFTSGKLKLPLPADVAEEPASADLASQILAVLTEADGPLMGKQIARRVGRDYGSYFRETLARLKDEGRVRHTTSEGYSIPEEEAED
jgi:hypothetical protein